MVHNMKELKRLVIERFYSEIADDKKAMKELEKEYDLPEEKMEKLVKKLLDMWLDSPDFIAFLSETMGIYPTDAEEKESGDQKEYIG